MNQQRSRQEPLSTTVYREIVQRLREGTLPPGSRMREEELAQSLGVSRTPVREALARLQARGLLELAPGGLTVTALDRRQVSELYALRAVLEGAAARMAASGDDAADLISIRHAADRFAGQKNAQDRARANALFHQAIYAAARNEYLQRALEDLNDSLSLLPRTTFQIPERHAEVCLEHERIVEAIAAKDPDAAEKAAREHIHQALAGRMRIEFTL